MKNRHLLTMFRSTDKGRGKDSKTWKFTCRPLKSQPCDIMLSYSCILLEFCHNYGIVNNIKYIDI